LSFVSKGASGFFGYISKLSAAAGQAVAAVSLDPEFRDWHNDKVVVAATNLNREWKRRGVQSVGLIVTRPIFDIVLGVVGGVSGIIISPVKGYQRNGPAGILLGTAAGCVGIFAKPLVCRSSCSHVLIFFPLLTFSSSIRSVFWTLQHISWRQSMILLRA
jgi:hypothetical protein